MLLTSFKAPGPLVLDYPRGSISALEITEQSAQYYWDSYIVIIPLTRAPPRIDKSPHSKVSEGDKMFVGLHSNLAVHCTFSFIYRFDYI